MRRLALRIVRPAAPKPISIMLQVAASGMAAAANVPVPEKRLVRPELPAGALKVGLAPEKDSEKSLSVR